jgi:hypothetical protein
MNGTDEENYNNITIITTIDHIPLGWAYVIDICDKYGS